MAFGMKPPAPPAEIVDRIRYDATAGRMFCVNYNPDTREKDLLDITLPPPRFALDFGGLEVGFIKFSAGAPDFKVVAEGRPLPAQPMELDEKKQLTYRSGFRIRCFGRVLDGLREWSSTAECVSQALEDCYARFREAPEAAKGQIPIVELSKTLPVTSGSGKRARTLYVPVLNIVGWTDRPACMGERTVPPPVVRQASPSPQSDPDLEDEIPF
jgi:hypothetical protein